MLFFIGILIVFGSVMTGFVMSHGHPMALYQPYEALIIMGSAFGAFVISNPLSVIISVAKKLPAVITGSRMNKEIYLDILALMFELLGRMRRNGMMAVEADIEQPKGSAVFGRFPRVLANVELTEYISDYMRLIISGNMIPHEMEALMDMEIDSRLHELQQPAAAMNRIADALPGFGIVAAVLGIVITMGAIGGEPEEIGAHVAAALVGTFLGILLAYGFFGPVASALEHIAQDEIKAYEAVKATLVASLNGMQPAVSVEFGRKTLFAEQRPSFKELEGHVRGKA